MKRNKHIVLVQSTCSWLMDSNTCHSSFIFSHATLCGMMIRVAREVIRFVHIYLCKSDNAEIPGSLQCRGLLFSKILTILNAKSSRNLLKFAALHWGAQLQVGTIVSEVYFGNSACQQRNFTNQILFIFVHNPLFTPSRRRNKNTTDDLTI